MTRLDVFISGDISSDICGRYIVLYLPKVLFIKEIRWYKYCRVHCAINDIANAQIFVSQFCNKL